MRDKVESLSTAAVRNLAGMLQEKMDPALLAVGSEKIIDFLTRVGEGAEYPTDAAGQPLRWQDDWIVDAIPAGASVLDLGCGDGHLLARLREEKNVRGQGVELDPAAVLACVRNGVPAMQTNLDEGLAGFSRKSFDYVVLEETLQTLMRPDKVLKAMLRVGRRGVVTFPNFAYLKVRLDLGLRGRMPRTEWLPYSWFDTPNIHLFSLQDFLDWCAEEGARVVSGFVLAEGQIRPMETTDNLYAEEALISVEAD